MIEFPNAGKRADYDIILAVFVLALSLAGFAFLFFIRYVPSLLEINAAIFFAAVFYIFFQLFLKKANADLSSSVKRYQAIGINILFFILIAVSNFFLFTTYPRSELFFLTLVFCCFLVCLEIFYSNSELHNFLILIKILILAVYLRVSLLYQFAGFYGVDPWTHMRWVSTLLQTGSLLQGSFEYSEYPIYHLSVLITTLLSGMGLKESLFLSVGFAYMIGIFFVYLFSRMIVDNRIALLAALIIAINQFHIVWGAWIIPTTLGVFFFSFILYIVLNRPQDIRFTGILFLLFALLLYLHTLSAVVALVALITLYLGKVVFENWPKITDQEKTGGYYISIIIIGAFSLIMAYRFIFIPYTEEITFLEFFTRPLLYDITTDTQFTGEAFAASGYLLNRVGFLLLVFFIAIGVFTWLNTDNFTSKKIWIISALFGLIVFSYIPALFDLGNFLVGRWLVFGMILGSPIIAQGIIACSGILRNPQMRIIIICLLIATLAFFMVNNQASNPYTPFYGNEGEDPIRNAYTENEFLSANSLVRYQTSDIVTDRSYWNHAIQYWDIMHNANQQRDVRNIAPAIKNSRDILVIRQYVISHAALFRDQEAYKIYRKSRADDINLVFNSGMVRGFI